VATVFARSRWLNIAATAAALPISTILLVGLIRCATDPRRRLAGLVPLLTLPLLLVWPFTEAGRFLIPLVPCLMVGMVEGLVLVLGLLFPATSHPPGGGQGPPRARREARPPEDADGDRPRKRLRRIASLIILLASIPYPAYALLTHRAEVRRRTHDAFDAACAWISRDARRPGPVLALHPAEVFWQTGRLAVAPESDDLIRQVRDQEIAYLLVDPAPYANAPPSPLARLVADRPGFVRRVFDGPVAVYEVATVP
jgi:hypothetical protein